MQSRFTAKGVNNEDKEVMLAYELKEDELELNNEDNNIEIY